jgi:hypothetical protein
MKKIILSFVLTFTAIAASAQVRITGTVKDSKGEPLIGAAVMLEGASSVGTVTDVDGAYVLNIKSAKDAVLTASSISFKSQSLPVGKSNVLNFVLEEDAELLEEVVVVGYGMMIYMAAMKGISPQYYEASAIDGANKTQQFFGITLPLLAPTTVFLLVTTFLSAMKVFQSVDILTSGGPSRSTEVFVYLIYRYAMVDFRMDRAATSAVMFFVILLTITAATMKVSDNNVNYDS